MARQSSERNRWRIVQKEVKKLFKTYNLGLFDWDNAPPGVSFRNFNIYIEEYLHIDRFEYQWRLIFDCFSGKIILFEVDGYRTANINELITGNIETGVDSSRILQLAESAIESLALVIEQEFADCELTMTG